MPYAFIHDVPATQQMYHEIRGLLPDRLPVGLISHMAIAREEGLRYVDVWATEADWIRFRDEYVGPAMRTVRAAHGISSDKWVATHEVVDVIDLWPAPR
jgi:hypothetical protein